MWVAVHWLLFTLCQIFFAFDSALPQAEVNKLRKQRTTNGAAATQQSRNHDLQQGANATSAMHRQTPPPRPRPLLLSDVV